jgi:hypothetical protein
MKPTPLFFNPYFWIGLVLLALAVWHEPIIMLIGAIGLLFLYQAVTLALECLIADNEDDRSGN